MNKTTFLQILIETDNSYGLLRTFMSNKFYMDTLKSLTPFLKKSAITKQRIWHVINGELSPMLCTCNNEVSWNIKNNNYRRFCSNPKCAHNDQSVKDKTEATCIKKFGFKTNLLTDDSKKNYSEKMIEKYGVDNPFKSKDVQEEINIYFILKYGVNRPMQTQEGKDALIASNLKRYGRITPNQINISDESFRIMNSKEELELLYNQNLSILDISHLLNIDYSQLCKKFKKFEIELRKSTGQCQLYDYIKSIYNGKIIVDDRITLNKKEIDIWLPDLNIGFEYDGIFWHCENSFDKITYHIEKDKIANEKGIKLYHIIDIEWHNKQELVKSNIAAILNKNNIIDATSIIPINISYTEAEEFFNNNHIDGFVPATFYAGLKYNNEIIMVMSFDIFNFNMFELKQFSNIKNKNVLNGYTILFNYLIKFTDSENVITYVNNRWETSELHKQHNFIYLKTVQSFFYTYNYKTIENNSDNTVDNLSVLLEDYDPSITEWENMKNHKFDRYWNSGKDLLMWTK